MKPVANVAWVMSPTGAHASADPAALSPFRDLPRPEPSPQAASGEAPAHGVGPSPAWAQVRARIAAAVGGR